MNDARDWFVMILVAAIWIAGTVFLFLHHSQPAIFATWCGLCTTMGGLYHWLTLRDQKVPDAGDGK